MSQPISRFTHPFDVARHPTLEPEVKRAVLASWASDASAVPDQPALRRPADIEQPVQVDDVLAVLRALNDNASQATRHRSCACRRQSAWRSVSRSADAEPITTVA